MSRAARPDVASAWRQSIAKQRGFIRTNLETEMEEIDELVTKLFSK
jgi:hypothetical protein